MTLPPPPWPLVSALYGDLTLELDARYGPNWTIALNGRGLDLVPGDRWAGLSEVERERGRCEIVEHWIAELQLAAEGKDGNK